MAMARALGGGRTSRNAGAAEIVMLVLIGRQQDALDRLEQWSKTENDGAARSWSQALALRATGDWRRLDHPERATLLERIAYARALHERVGDARVMDFLEASHPESVADWSRILTDQGTSVETGQLIEASAIAEELAEAADVWPAAAGHRGDVAALAETLNDGPPPAAALDQDHEPYRVIDWPTWRAFVQRHLAKKLTAIVYLHEYTLKSRNAHDVVMGFDKMFGRSPLYPLIRRTYAFERPQYAVAMADSRALIKTHPELITAAEWTLLSERWNGANPPENMPAAITWFGPLVPRGTAYDASHRIFGVRRSLMAQPALLAELKAMAPYEPTPILELARVRLGAKPAFDLLKREVGPMGEYDRTVLFRLADAAGDDIERYLPVGRRLCEMRADDCKTVGAYLVDHDRESEAAVQYRFFAEHARDRVGVANGIGWLVMYDFDNGRTAEAVTLADEAAEVYSYGGLITKAKLLERMEQFDAAEALLKAASTRYDRYVDLTAFYLRRLRTPEGLKQFEAVSKPLVAKAFPNGIERVAGPLPDEPPTDGIRVRSTGHRGVAAGFADEDIILAVDGVRVHNLDQFKIAWMMSPEADVAFLAFRNGKSFEIRGALRERWQSGSFVGYDWRQPILDR